MIQTPGVGPSRPGPCLPLHPHSLAILLIHDAPATWHSNMFLPLPFPPPGVLLPHSSQACLPLHSGLCSKVPTSEKPSLTLYLRWNTHAFPICTICLLHPVLIYNSHHHWHYDIFIYSLVGICYPSLPYWNVRKLLGLYLCYSLLHPWSRMVPGT